MIWISYRKKVKIYQCVSFICVVVFIFYVVIIVRQNGERPAGHHYKSLLAQFAKGPFYLINPNLCSNNGTNLLIYVHSAPDNLERRLAIRETFGSPATLKKYKAQIVFIVGVNKVTYKRNRLIMENNYYKDIVLSNFIDDYHNLTLKAQSALTWVSQYCSSAPYVLKIDDDVFVHIERLQKYIQSVNVGSRQPTNLLACNLHMSLNPDRRSKYYISDEEYPDTKYPQYCQGLAYLMSSDVVRKLNDGIRNPMMNKPIIWLDDVYITGIMVKNLGIKHTDLSSAYRNCADIDLMHFDKSLIFFQTEDWHSLWQSVQNSNDSIIHRRNVWLDIWRWIRDCPIQ